MTQIKGDTYELSTGRVIEASCGGFIGLVKTLAGKFEVGTGSDGELFEAAPDYKPDEYRPAFTPNERAELATFMIARWTEYRDAS